MNIIIEKLPDGRIQSKAYIKADGSATTTTYANAQEAALALPILDKSATDTIKNPDRVFLTLNPEDGSVISSQFQVFSRSEDDAGESSFKIQEAAKAKVLDLANDILVKDGKPVIAPQPADDVGGVISEDTPLNP
jgi:hypothetical protein